MKTLLTAIGASLFGSVITLIISFVFLTKNGYLTGNDCDVYGNVYACYITDRGAWNDTAYLQTITSFYGLIITLLVAASTIVAALGAYTLRLSNKNQIESEIPAFVTEHFEKERAKDMLQSIVKLVAIDEISRRLQDMDRPVSGALLRDIEYIEQKVDQLTVQVEKLVE